MNILTDRVYSFNLTAKREIARDVKEKPCCTCLGLDTEHKSDAEMDKEKEDLRAPRRKHHHRVHDTSFQSITKCDVDIRKKTYEPPDENIFSVGAKRFRCVEVLLQPVSLARAT